MILENEGGNYSREKSIQCFFEKGFQPVMHYKMKGLGLKIGANVGGQRGQRVKSTVRRLNSKTFSFGTLDSFLAHKPVQQSRQQALGDYFHFFVL